MINKSRNDQNDHAKKNEIKVIRAKQFDSGKIGLSLEINGVTINNCWWNEGTRQDGSEYGFVSFPSFKGSNDRYYRTAYIDLSDKENAYIEKEIEKLI